MFTEMLLPGAALLPPGLKKDVFHHGGGHEDLSRDAFGMDDAIDVPATSVLLIGPNYWLNP